MSSRLRFLKSNRRLIVFGFVEAFGPQSAYSLNFCPVDSTWNRVVICCSIAANLPFGGGGVMVVCAEKLCDRGVMLDGGSCVSEVDATVEPPMFAGDGLENGVVEGIDALTLLNGSRSPVCG